MPRKRIGGVVDLGSSGHPEAAGIMVRMMCLRLSRAKPTWEREGRPQGNTYKHLSAYTASAADVETNGVAISRVLIDTSDCVNKIPHSG